MPPRSCLLGSHRCTRCLPACNDLGLLRQAQTCFFLPPLYLIANPSLIRVAEMLIPSRVYRLINKRPYLSSLPPSKLSMYTSLPQSTFILALLSKPSSFSLIRSGCRFVLILDSGVSIPLERHRCLVFVIPNPTGISTSIVSPSMTRTTLALKIYSCLMFFLLVIFMSRPLYSVITLAMIPIIFRHKSFVLFCCWIILQESTPSIPRLL